MADCAGTRENGSAGLPGGGVVHRCSRDSSRDSVDAIRSREARSGPEQPWHASAEHAMQELLLRDHRASRIEIVAAGNDAPGLRYVVARVWPGNATETVRANAQLQPRRRGARFLFPCLAAGGCKRVLAGRLPSSLSYSACDPIQNHTRSAFTSTAIAR